jgi:hypothetical protein
MARRAPPIVAVFPSSCFTRMAAVSDEWAAEARDRLPAMVRRFVERNLPERALSDLTRVSQRGGMWRSSGSKPMGFTAVAEYGVRRVAFSWRGEVSGRGPDRLVVDRRA